MTKTELLAKLHRLGACPAGLAWARETPLEPEQLWQQTPSEYVVWLCDRLEPLWATYEAHARPLLLAYKAQETALLDAYSTQVTPLQDSYKDAVTALWGTDRAQVQELWKSHQTQLHPVRETYRAQRRCLRDSYEAQVGVAVRAAMPWEMVEAAVEECELELLGESPPTGDVS